jgi:hypothetical protein
MRSRVDGDAEGIWGVGYPARRRARIGRMGTGEWKMKLILKPEEIAYPNGLEIAVDGFTGDPGGVKPSQVFIEVYEGKLRVHVWIDESEDPAVSAQIQPLPEQPNPATLATSLSVGDQR